MIIRPERRGFGSCVLLVASGCGGIQPPVTPDPSLLGCYRLETDLPASYSDSLGYEIPGVIRLGYTSHGQWTVLPTDREWHPSWSVYDGLPSGYTRRAVAHRRVPVAQWDSVQRIPGDSIDIAFPSAIGTLVFRIGTNWDGEGFGGRAEWVTHRYISFMNEGRGVRARPTSCDDLHPALERTRYR